MKHLLKASSEVIGLLILATLGVVIYVIAKYGLAIIMLGAITVAGLAYAKSQRKCTCQACKAHKAKEEAPMEDHRMTEYRKFLQDMDNFQDKQ